MFYAVCLRIRFAPTIIYLPVMYYRYLLLNIHCSSHMMTVGHLLLVATGFLIEFYILKNELYKSTTRVVSWGPYYQSEMMLLHAFSQREGSVYLKTILPPVNLLILYLCVVKKKSWLAWWHIIRYNNNNFFFIYCGLVTPYGDIILGQHWLR